MAAQRKPGFTQAKTTMIPIQDGTSALLASPRPGSVGVAGGDVEHWTIQHKLLAAMRLTVPKLPSDMRTGLLSLLSAENIAVTGAVLGVWGASHLVGVGEAADAGILIFGAVMMGSQAFQAGRELGLYLNVAAHATSRHDLDAAAGHLATAITIVGVTVFVGLVMKAAGKTIAKTGQRLRITSEGKPGPWFEASDFGENYRGTTVPKGFMIKVQGQNFRVTANATKHMAEYVSKTATVGGVSPWAQGSEIDYPLSSIAGALEQAAIRFREMPPQRHRLMMFGNWELGIDTTPQPWVVEHAVPKGR